MTDVISLSDVCSLITKGTTPTAQDGSFVHKGINYIKSESLSYGGSIDRSAFCFISASTHDKLRRSQIQDRDILYSIAGANLGKCGIAGEDILPANTNQAVAIIRVDQRRASPEFVSYVLRDKAFVQMVLGGVAQSAQPNVNLGDIGRFRIPAWPLPYQRAVASVLGALDDRIHLNRRMNETLESIARAIFKDWFVDFGPTRAKMERRAPYLASNIWSLFPDRLDEYDTPAGWDKTTLADFAVLNPESWSRSTYPDAIEYVDLSNTKWGAIELTTHYKRETAPSRAQRVLKAGDTIVGTVRPGNGSYAVVSANGMTGSTGFAVLRPSEPRFRELVYFASTAPKNIVRLEHLANGGAYPAVSPDLVIGTELISIPQSLCDEFSALTGALLDLAEANKREMATLATMRDFLLPKLISGAVTVKDIENSVGEAT
jgi:type I restriction enzyme, S subunit